MARLLGQPRRPARWARWLSLALVVVALGAAASWIVSLLGYLAR